ncbi:MAG TPA: Nramp family divalent metal transporter [Gemmatimonadaceae bacterium]|nr:Nramp family divalent metal transporter [Gemmatimonadaceae bacterium]
MAGTRPRGGLRYYLRRLGPGLVTGAANDDPGAIGTHAQVGARYGVDGLWLAPYTLPITAVVLEMCAQIGNVSGRGLVTILRFHYPRWVLWGAVGLFTIANLANLAADLGVMAESVKLLVGGPGRVWLVLLAALSAALQLFVPYATYARVLKGLALSLFAYVVAVFLVPQDWGAVLRATLVPTIHADASFLMSVVAVVGTRLSPYVLVWQPAQVVEEDIDDGKTRLADRMGASRREVRAAQVDVIAGSTVANLVTWAIMATAAATLHERGITNISTAAQAADALRPAAGELAYALFALGILATGLLAVPVLAGGIGYAVGEALGWRRGLGREAGQARRFYGVIVGCIAIAVLLALTGVNPMRALVLSQVLNGLVAIPLVFLVLRICNDPRIMGERTNGPLANTLGWATFAIVAAVGAAALWGIARGM